MLKRKIFYRVYFITAGGIDQRVSAILALCQERGVHVVHALSRRRLALILRKKYKMGCVGIFSYDGAEVWAESFVQLSSRTTVPALNSPKRHLHVLY